MYIIKHESPHPNTMFYYSILEWSSVNGYTEVYYIPETKIHILEKILFLSNIKLQNDTPTKISNDLFNLIYKNIKI